MFFLKHIINDFHEVIEKINNQKGKRKFTNHDSVRTIKQK